LPFSRFSREYYGAVAGCSDSGLPFRGSERPRNHHGRETLSIHQSFRAFAALLYAGLAAGAAGPPAVGGKAPDFELTNLEGKPVRLSEVTTKESVVLIVLRGYPGYQCPFCSRQVQDFIRNAQSFADAGARVMIVYPGPGQAIRERAAEFVAGKPMPQHFDFLPDPDYAFTNLYGLRWDAPHETAYPATFLIDREGCVFFSKVVKSHAGRTTAAEVLEALPKPKPARSRPMTSSPG